MPRCLRAQHSITNQSCQRSSQRCYLKATNVIHQYQSTHLCCTRALQAFIIYNRARSTTEPTHQASISPRNNETPLSGSGKQGPRYPSTVQYHRSAHSIHTSTSDLKHQTLDHGSGDWPSRRHSTSNHLDQDIAKDNIKVTETARVQRNTWRGRFANHAGQRTQLRRSRA